MAIRFNEGGPQRTMIAGEYDRTIALALMAVAEGLDAVDKTLQNIMVKL